VTCEAPAVAPQQSSLLLTASTIADGRDREIIEGIKRSLADSEAGWLVSHNEAMAEGYAAMKMAKAARDDKA